MAANMDTTGTFELATVFAENQLLTAIHKHYTIEDWVKFTNNLGAERQNLLNYMAVTAGTGESDWERVTGIISAVAAINPDVSLLICLDVANGYTEFFAETVRRYRDKYPEHIIIAGNVVTGEMVEQLTLSGADIIKVGIGPGSVCTTRKKTGVGYPQLSAVIECADAAHGLKALIIADGGIRNSGDMAKSIGAGADICMLGGMLAGHDESGGEVIEKIVNNEIKKFKLFYGMSSDTAMNKYAGGVAKYRASEGKTVECPYRGPIAETINDMLGGLRSACTYVGSSDIKDLSKRTTFIRVTQQTNDIFGPS